MTRTMPRAIPVLVLLIACTAGCHGGDDPGPGGDAADGAAPGGDGDGSSSGDDGAGGDGGGDGAGDGAGDGSGGGADGVDAGDPTCLEATAPCDDESQCCGDLSCGSTTLGQVCCGEVGAPCATENGEDCCGALLCISGACSEPFECEAPCTEAPALVTEKLRLRDIIGGSFLGICGDANHTYGYHVPAARLPSSDYSLEGAANTPVCEWHAAAIDIGMDWPVSRDWLRWLIEEIRTDRIQGIAEVIGSYDGVDVRYWSDSSGWETDGVPYQGEGHDTWTHVSVYRSTALQDHHILSGWTATSGP